MLSFKDYVSGAYHFGKNQTIKSYQAVGKPLAMASADIIDGVLNVVPLIGDPVGDVLSSAIKAGAALGDVTTKVGAPVYGAMAATAAALTYPHYRYYAWMGRNVSKAFRPWKKLIGGVIKYGKKL